MDLLLAEVAEIRANTVAPNSRLIYANSMARFIHWLLENNPDAVCEDFIDALEAKGGQTKENVKWLLNNHEVPPFSFGRFDAKIFMAWIVSLRTSGGERPGYQSYNSHRSALFNLFRDYGETMSPFLVREMANNFKGFLFNAGLKRTATQAIGRGDGSVKVGKDPLPFGLYKFLCQEFLKESGRELVFAQCFMVAFHLTKVICSNLMCRSANAVNIKFEHMFWKEDALCIYFAQQKNDQNGERKRYPRHVYPNPIIPGHPTITKISFFHPILF